MPSLTHHFHNFYNIKPHKLSGFVPLVFHVEHLCCINLHFGACHWWITAAKTSSQDCDCLFPLWCVFRKRHSIMSYGVCGILSTSHWENELQRIQTLIQLIDTMTARKYFSWKCTALSIYIYNRLQIISRLVSLVLTGSMVLHRNTELPSSGFFFSETILAAEEKHVFNVCLPYTPQTFKVFLLLRIHSSKHSLWISWLKLFQWKDQRGQKTEQNSSEYKFASSSDGSLIGSDNEVLSPKIQKIMLSIFCFLVHCPIFHLTLDPWNPAVSTLPLPVHTEKG